MIVTLMIGAENFWGKDMTNSWSLDQPEKNLSGKSEDRHLKFDM